MYICALEKFFLFSSLNSIRSTNVALVHNGLCITEVADFEKPNVEYKNKLDMKKNWTIKIPIPNPLFWLYAVRYRFHKCKFDSKLYDIPMENNTNFLITQCRCGKTNMVRAHRESPMYKDWVK